MGISQRCFFPLLYAVLPRFPKCAPLPNAADGQRTLPTATNSRRFTHRATAAGAKESEQSERATFRSIFDDYSPFIIKV
ncbi:hypothetical protein niasHT_015080 [Heterodera trifolii]|uniref:Secreted protein n=1 Tax=Heterodera trifolii TaxID=157864 RepID=A0ABD2LAF0_9BILA